MESRAKFLGHALHQQLIVFPLGLLVTAVIFDVVYLITGNEIFAVIAFYNILGGLIGGALAAVFGFRDFAAIPRDTRAKRIGFLHGIGNLIVILLFSVSWAFRLTVEGHIPQFLALAASFLGVALAGITAWMGGELVARLGVGVDPGANLNAPNSLYTESTQPVRVETVPVTGQTKVLADPDPEIEREDS
jgi:uncharacterized membrane protein